MRLFIATPKIQPSYDCTEAVVIRARSAIHAVELLKTVNLGDNQNDQWNVTPLTTTGAAGVLVRAFRAG